MRRRWAIALALTLVLCMGGVTAASAAGAGRGDAHHGRGGFVPVHRLAGLTGDELIGEWWARILAIPAAENPVADPAVPGLCLRFGPRDRILSPTKDSGELTCTMRAGTPLYLALPSAECSSAEPPPFFGATEAEQQACATASAFDPNWVTGITLSLDGGPEQDVFSERFRDVSPQTETVFPDDPIFDATPGPATFVAAGYAATLRRDLRPGRHVISAVKTFTEGDPFRAMWTLNVVGRHGGG